MIGRHLWTRTGIVVMLLLLASSCSTTGNPLPTSTTLWVPLAGEAPPLPDLDTEQVARGSDLYQEHCASCHGADLAGDPNWETPNPDGTFLPPPHDSSGHTWHHSDQLLLEIIRDGSDFPLTQMPTFGGLLSDEEIVAIIEFLKANWGPEERDFQWQVTWQESQLLPSP